MKVIQGGEQKVMKKILSVALSTAMAFSMFASVAFGADATPTTPQDKFDALKAAGIVEGLPDGQSHLEKTLTRAELAKIITKSLGLKEVTGVYTYKDANYGPNHWAAPFIEAVTAAGIMQGSTVNGKQMFSPSGNVTAQELAIVLTRALKLEVPTEGIDNTASTWAQGEVQAALNAGFLADITNWQANSTRSSAIVAAYAVWEAAQIPTVASYEVKDATHVDFTLSTGEVVNVELETALVANVETPVEFKDAAGDTISTKVTWVSTAAQTVKSVAADSLKQVVVTFDGTVDPATAGDADNYSIDNVTIASAAVSEDNTKVTLLLDEDSAALENKEQTTLSINNVKNSDGTVTFSKDVDFTPVDVTAPTISSVTSLGTKAFKIKFSEPVNESQAADASNYSIDGGTVAASIQYSYPDTVIVNADLTEGDHTVAVSNVTDFSGLVAAPVEQSFKVTADTAAPEVTSIKSNDLQQVVITFNEAIKSIDDVYANTTSNDGVVTSINDNVVTVNFPNPLAYASNTIYINGVSDYSDNSADRTATVTPTVDTTRPTVVSSSFYKDGSDYKVDLKFSKSVKESSAEDISNYVLKDAAGNVADTDYTNASGNPELGAVLDTATNKTVTINLGSNLTSQVYTLTVSGVTDTAFVANAMLPQTVSLDVASLADHVLSKVWSDTNYVYLTFSNGVQTTGTGSALDAAKYSFNDGTDNYSFKGTVRLTNSNTVRLSIADFKTSAGVALTATAAASGSVTAGYITDASGAYYTQAGGYILTKDVDTANPQIQTGSSYVSSTTKAVLVFDTALSSVNKNDFEINAKTPSSYSLSSDRKTLTLTFSDSLGTGVYTLITATAPLTQDAFGNKIQAYSGSIADQVAPALSATAVTYNVAGTTDLTFAWTFSEGLKDITAPANTSLYPIGLIKSLFTVKLDNTTLTADQFTVAQSGAGNNVLTLAVDPAAYPAGFNAGSKVSVTFAGGSGAIADAAGNKVASFSTVRTVATGNTITN